jgi:biopolymer transport protein ExbD
MSRRGKDAPIGVEVAITPMLDMTFQMLFFFILNYHPSAVTESQMAMALPAENKNAKAQNQNEVKNSNDDDDDGTLPADLVLKIKTQNDGYNNGAISELAVEEHGLSKTIKSLDDLYTYLKDVKEKQQLSNNEDVTLKPDSRLQWRDVVKVMDVCQKAGFHVGFGAPPDLGVNQ